MRLFLSALLSTVFFACGDNPLAERGEKLEQRLDEVEAAQEEERLSLLARLDALAVTADNAEEIVAVRAKLNQTSITRREFEDLQDRVDELEGQIGDWSGVVNSLQRSVYAVLYAEYEDDGELLYVSFIGTGFAVESGTIVTNGHVVDVLVEWDADLAAYNQRHGTNYYSEWLVVQNLTIYLKYQSNFFSIGEYYTHPEWDGDPSSPDVGTLHIWEGYISRRTTLATSNEASRLRVGAPIATLGFPGELQGVSDWGDFYPIATFKDGTISALRPRFEELEYTAPRDTYIIQHNLDLSGGTSGSPIFDASGRVVAINNAGIDYNVFDIGGETTQVSQAALGFGIRADKIHDVLDDLGIAAKRTTHAGPSRLASRLNGRDIRSLDIVTTREGLAERLERME